VAPSPDALQDTVDEVAIRGLIAAYADVVNTRIWNEFEALFVPDAPVLLELRNRPPMRFSAPGGIAEFIGGALEQYPFFEFVALNLRVWLRMGGDPDRAFVRTWMCELRQDHDGVASRAFGVYQDDVLRAGEQEWRFAARHYQSIGRGEYGLDLMGAPEIH
jgi:SnoaL-like domain